MSPLKELHPFVYLFQACGMIPFTVEHQPTSNVQRQFGNFTFSFKRLTTWWFIISFVFQFTIPFGLMKVGAELVRDFSTDEETPITIRVLGVITIACGFLELIICRWLVIRRYKRLNNALKAIQQIDSCLGSVSEDHDVNLKRFIMSMILSIAPGLSILLLMIPIYPYVFGDLELLPSIALLYILSSTIITNDCSLLLIHLCYYLIAKYVNIFRSHIDNDLQISVPSSAKIIKTSFNGFFCDIMTPKAETLKKYVKGFDLLYRATSELNQTFSLHVLFLLTIKFVTLITTTFAYIFTVTNTAPSMFRDTSSIMLVASIWEMIRFAVILSSADLPPNQIRMFRERVFAALHSGFSLEFSEKVLIIALLTQVKEDRIRLSAAGLFRVGVHLIPPLAGTLLTYMVVLLQN